MVFVLTNIGMSCLVVGLFYDLACFFIVIFMILSSLTLQFALILP